ncbi:hypothetical protein [Pseudomonas putida]|uniref:hypothetical protein n=1 Tax=Pseudomonas putida TaxID=303 RepID=UPI000310A7CC|nr:hypothetical protein [Pseudomonas putida]
MAGQVIVLPGVTAAASAGAPRINMNAADIAASKVVSLKHVVSARSLTAAPGGGVVGRCRNTGANLTPKGTGQALLGVTSLAGRSALGLTASGSAGLALPAGSLTNSFTYVTAVYLGATDIAGSSAINFLAGFDAADAYITASLRYYGQAYASPVSRADKFSSFSPQTSTPGADGAGAVAGWNVVTVDFNNDSRILSIAVNQAVTFAAVLKPTPAGYASSSYLEVGYHLGNALLNSKFGDLYTFSDSLLKSDLGKAQLSDLVAALKAYYSIA